MPRGAFKRKASLADKKMATLERMVIALEEKEANRAAREQHMRDEAQRSKEYQEFRLSLTERMVAAREREVRLAEEASAAEQQRHHNESMTSQMLQIARSNISVVRLLEMRREYEQQKEGGKPRVWWDKCVCGGGGVRETVRIECWQWGALQVRGRGGRRKEEEG